MKLKRIASLMLVAVMVFALGTVAFAAEVDVVSVMETGMTGIQTDIMGILAVVLPILLAVVGVTVAIKFGLKYAKKVG